VVIYPKVGLWDDGAHHNLVFNFFGQYQWPGMTRVDTDRLLTDVTHALDASERDAIISSETLSERADIERFVRALTSLPVRYPMTVELLVVCREHFELVASNYSQSVTVDLFSERKAPDEYLRSYATGFTYASLITRLRNTGARVSVLNYHPAAGLVERFMRHIGFAPDQVPPSETRNVSLSPKGLIATLAANNAAVGVEQRQRFVDALRRTPGFVGPSDFIFGGEAARQVAPIFQADRYFLEREFGIRLPARDLSIEENRFRLSDSDVNDIRAALVGFGHQGDALIEFALRFRRAAH
jgi:hypothetical protein